MPHEFEIREEVSLEATPEHVWTAIATGPGIASWFMAMPAEPDATSATVWQPPHHLKIQTPQTPDGATQAFEYLIEAREGGSTVLRFAHTGFLGGDWGAEFDELTGAGWRMYLHTLAEYLAHFPDRFASYVSAQGPAASADPDAWDRVPHALGLNESATPGDPVRLTPAGLPPIDGVVDYLSANFVGLRTRDALYRFHGRAALGLPIAVGHHLFAGDVDEQATCNAWRTWLARLF